MLQVFDDGRLTDNKGVTVDFRNTILILTSNIQNNKLKDTFKPEFLNRLDEIVNFKKLEQNDIVKILDIFLKKIEKKVAERGIKLIISDSAKEYIANIGFDDVYGARPLKRALYEEIEDRIADLILEDKIKDGNSIHFDFINHEIVVKVI